MNELCRGYLNVACINNSRKNKGMKFQPKGENEALAVNGFVKLSSVWILRIEN